MTDKLGNSGRKNGRPAKGDPPRVPYEELDRILVFGEVVNCEDGESTTVHYPSYRDLARRYGVCNSVIARYSKKHNCLRRREQAKARIAVETDKKLVDLRSTAIAMSKDDELRIIDTYLAEFEMALADGRVRFDNPTDFNTMVRLKEFIQGGADSRQEIHAALSLEDIQARHRRMLKTVEASSTAECGELDDRVLAVPVSGLQPQGSNPPSAASLTGAEEVTGDSSLTGMVPRADTAHPSPPVAPCAAEAEEWNQDAEPCHTARQGANVAPTAGVAEGSGDEDGDERDDG